MSGRSLLDQDFARWSSGSPKFEVGTTRQSRMAILASFALLWSALVIWRLYDLQIVGNANWKRSATKQHSTKIQLTAERGKIFDRNGKVLAISVPAGSVYVRPGILRKLDPDPTANAQKKQAYSEELAKILQMDAKLILEKMNQNKPFVWIKRQIPRVQAQLIDDLAAPGVGYFVEARRYYPYREAGSVLIGKVGIDGKGLSGIESRFDKVLGGAGHEAEMGRDALGNAIVDEKFDEEFELPQGNALTLTLDAELQSILDEELEKGQGLTHAQHILAAMINADTGEILAMNQTPMINFNTDSLSGDALHNRVVETVFEPGSVMKPLVVGAALELGVLKPNEVIDCEGGKYKFGRHIINDVHPKGLLSVKDVVVQSSNIGMTKIALRMGSEKMYGSLRAFGFGEKIPLGLQGETSGILRPVNTWAKIDVATHSFGQGVAVTTLQLVRAVAAIVNGGYLPTLSVMKSDTANKRTRILSEKNAALVADMMVGVVEDEHGTGQKAAITGAKIGGKTGTAQRARDDGRGYSPGSYIASFIGFGDASAIGIKDKLVLGVVVDRPKADTIYGGTLAAPIFKRIMQRSMHLLETRNARQ